jgi:two-component system phosphate regulon sensor histidine kinase PhoR
LKNRDIRWILIIAAFAIAGLIFMQVNFINKAFELNAGQFNDKVSLALIAVAEQVNKNKRDSTSSIEAVEQVTEDYFTVNVNDTVNHRFVENLLHLEFAKYGVEADYQYVIYDCFADSIIWRGYSNKPGEEDLFTINRSLPSNVLPKDSHKIGVYFPGKKQYILSQMNVFVFSGMGLFVIICFFIYILYVILKQKKLSEIKSDFINNMTHEFKTPISTINLSADALGKPGIEKNPDRIRRYAQIIKDEGLRLRNHVDKILKIAVLDGNTPEFKSEPVDMHEQIEKAAEIIRIRIDERNGRLETNFHAQHKMVKGDADHLSNILLNVLGNALKYTEKEPYIRINTKNEGKYMVISISDNGIGIPDKYKKYIFNKFYRVSTGNVHNVKGFGLGLYYVNKIVKLHGGSITVESEPDKGSTFSIKLPVIKKL